MKQIKLILTLLISSLLIAGCASTPRTLDEKYLFPDLEQVDHIRSYSIDGWSDIDRQSLIVSTSPSTSYLIILRSPSNELRFAEGIRFSPSGSTVHAKFDRIEIIDRQAGIQPMPAFIDRMYKLESREQRKMVRAQILGKPYEAIDDESVDSEKENITEAQ